MAADGTAAAEEETPQIIDGLPLIEAATKHKEQGNDCVKKKKHSDAVRHYEAGIAVLDKALGHPMLRSELEQLLTLKSVLHCNIAQCLLDLKLYRRALEAATECLKLDENNVKALHRRSKANEALRHYDAALADATKLQGLGGGQLTPEAMDERLSTLRRKQEEVRLAKEEESSEDEADTKLVNMKQRFDEVVEKYDLKDGTAASEIAEWVTSGEWHVTVRRMQTRWGMEEEDAEAFLRWIQKGLEFKAQNAANQAMAEATSPVEDIA